MRGLEGFEGQAVEGSWSFVAWGSGVSRLRAFARFRVLTLISFAWLKDSEKLLLRLLRFVCLYRMQTSGSAVRIEGI